MGRVTIKTLAEALGVSATTVSNAYNKPEQLSVDLRDRILAKADELGYSGPDAAGRALRSGRTNAYGVLFSERLSYAFSDPYSVLFLSGMSEVMEQQSAGILLLPVGPDTDSVATRSAAIDGLATMCVGARHPAVDVARMRNLRIVATDITDDGSDFAAIDDTEAGRLIGTHLHRLGHRRIGVVLETGDEGRHVLTDADLRRLESESGTRGFTDVDWRLQGLRATMPGAEFTYVTGGHNARTSGRRAAELLLDVQDRPTALVALSDVLALGILDAMDDRALTAGRDISVTGFDDLPDARRVGLTTVRQPIEQKGRLVAELLLDPERAERQIVLPTELVVRSSTAPAPRT